MKEIELKNMNHTMGAIYQRSIQAPKKNQPSQVQVLQHQQPLGGLKGSEGGGWLRDLGGACNVPWFPLV